MNTQEATSSKTLLIVAWLIVGLPGLWGVEQTIVKSMSLFHAPPPAMAK